MRLALIYLVVALTAVNAKAKKVYAPHVERGEAEAAYFLDHSGGGQARHQLEFEYGLTDRWLTAVYGDFRQVPGEKLAFHGFKWENIYEVSSGAGLYLEYVRPKTSLNKPDDMEFKLLLEGTTGQLVHTANVGFKKELGADAASGAESVYSWRSRWHGDSEVAVSLEIYGSPSAGTHQAGPVLSGEIADQLDFEIGYLVGLDAASEDGVLKLILTHEF